MHSKIFEISRSPISKDNRLTSAYFEDDHESYADYIGDDVEESERAYYIDIFNVFPFLKVDGDKVTFTSTQDLHTFIDVWIDEIKEKVASLDIDNIFRTDGYIAEKMFEITHENIYSRFYIHDYNGWAAPVSDFIEWCQGLTDGDEFYIGGIIDFHH